MLNWLKDAWTGVKNFFGFGDDEEMTIKVKPDANNEIKYSAVSKAGISQNNSSNTQYTIQGGITIVSPDPKKSGEQVTGVLTPNYLQNSMGRMGK